MAELMLTGMFTDDIPFFLLGFSPLSLRTIPILERAS